MLDAKGFDQWTDQYDLETAASDQNNTYPFAGYHNVLAYIEKMIRQAKYQKILDLGFGTAVLTSRLYEAGCEIYGQDFSQEMCVTAQKKMPDAHLYCADLYDGLAEELKDRNYDCIIATYSLHHLSNDKKGELIRDLMKHLEPGGSILIGDIMFETEADMEQCRRNAGEEWDEEEIYIAADQMRNSFPSLQFRKISNCGGVISLTDHRIRRAEPEDLARIAEIQIFNYRLYFYPIFKSDEYYFGDLQVPSLMKDYENSLDTLYVYDDGVVKGFIKVEDTYIARLFVEPVLQNAAIGSALLNFAVNRFHADHLWALEKNTRAIRFYERHGFALTGEKKLEEGTEEYLVLMRYKEEKENG
ncbi:MAG: GNAT family N-acetyltransferase [Solobacterium sp.]|nr:GNAT family N-acetyltransferase [Solobacterium sp.]